MLLAFCLLSACAQAPAPPQAPGQALAWRRLRWQDETGRIAPGALAGALATRDRIVRAQPLTGGIAPAAWSERGPYNVGGRTRALLVHPTNPNRLIAGAVGGGVWTSDDGGVIWQPVDDWMARLSVCALAFAPGNPNVVYAGTGEGYFNGDALGGAGLFRSSDGGRTFAQLPATAAWDNVCRIAVHPTNPQVLLVGKRYGGIQRSADGGASWTNPQWAQGCYQVLFDPNNPQQAVAHLIDWDGSAWFHRVVWSQDAGATWTPAATGLHKVVGFDPRIELAYAKSVPNLVYAVCALDGGKIWKSVDGGRNWARVTTSGASGSSWYACPLWVDPTNPNVLVTGGYHVFRSVDGGQTLQQISDGYILTSQPHPDIHFFTTNATFDGSSDKRFYVCTDGGVHRTEDVYTASTTAGWSTRQFRYRTTQFYGAAGDAASGRIVGGTQDNGTLTLAPGAQSAALTFGGDGGFCAIDPTDPKYVYGEYINLQIHRSSNAGTSAAYIWNGIADAGSNANFIAPFVLDPSDPNTMLAGGRSLWRSSNVKAPTPTWTAIRGPGTDHLSAIAIARSDRARIWIGLNNGEVWKTSNGTAAAPTWTAVDDNAARNPLPKRYVTRILLDDADPEIAYVAFGGFATDNLWRTANGGTSFANIHSAGPVPLPAAPIYGIARHPSQPDWLYVGTEVGVFATEDRGAHWSTTNDGPANASVDELVFLHGSTTLLAATHGRGLFTAPVHKAATLAFGSGCAGSAGVPLLTANPAMPPQPGRNFGVYFYNLRPNANAWLLLGGSRTQWGAYGLPLALDFAGMPGCALHVSLQALAPANANALGAGNWSVPVPDDRSLLGAKFYVQLLAADAGVNAAGLVVGNGLEAGVGY